MRDRGSWGQGGGGVSEGWGEVGDKGEVSEGWGEVGTRGR